MAVLVARELYRFYHAGEAETLALRGVSLEVEKGELVAIMGPSGSGKSTLLACLAGLDEPDGGYVQIEECRMTRRSETERAALRARYIGVMLQTGNLLDHLTVEENLLLPMQLARRVDRKSVQSLLAQVALPNKQHAMPGHLSGGEAARVALAVALATSPALLLADEPTGQVDAATAENVLQLIKGFCGSGGVAILVTHSPAVAAHASRVIQLLDGQIVDHG